MLDLVPDHEKTKLNDRLLRLSEIILNISIGMAWVISLLILVSIFPFHRAEPADRLTAASHSQQPRF